MKSPTSISSLFKKKKPSSYQLIYNGMCNKQQNNKDAQLKIMLDWSIFSLFGLKEKKIKRRSGDRGTFEKEREGGFFWVRARKRIKAFTE